MLLLRLTLLRPSLGAYFATKPIPATSLGPRSTSWNIYATPAAISLLLLILEVAYLAAKLPETKGWRKTDPDAESKTYPTVTESVEARLARLRAIGRLHGYFLLFFSGVRPPLHPCCCGNAKYNRRSSPLLSLLTIYLKRQTLRTVVCYLVRSLS